jgi:uncharacterized protein
MTESLTEGADDAPAHLILAHGAGAPMTSSFMETIARLIAGHGLKVSRFEFEYMAARREGLRRPPPRAERLTPEFEAVVTSIAAGAPRRQRLFIGGKSMGGRVASLIASELHASGRIAGLVCLGYPFHPAKKPEQLRTAHLANLTVPSLIVQGERDPLGTREEVDGYDLSDAIQICWLTDGDHDLAPRKASGATLEENLAVAAAAIGKFCISHT